MNADVLKAAVDEVFAEFEKKAEGHPFLLATLKGANVIVDEMIPALAAKLSVKFNFSAGA